ncbi:MAG: HAD family hydrolase [Tannerella sp.]|jgi:phosphoglycolate phosphatase-like HAD superfamily hydrolase|nr:HAD family hydrolase [Tannerella sp.]
MIEILNPLPDIRPRLRAALFDFDGTLSTLRCGWEEVMEPLMIEFIAGKTEVDDDLIAEVKAYIDQSTGIQTYYQMEWLANEVKKRGRNPDAGDDPWWYKDEYNRRLMERVALRREAVASGRQATDDYLMAGSREILKALVDNDIAIYIASGTDHEDVRTEADILGLAPYFTELAGAPARKAECSKEAVIRKMLTDCHLQGQEFAVFGDGKVEIRLGAEVQAITIGVASNEMQRCGINPVKRQRLAEAGADAIIGDFSRIDEIFNFLNIK